MENKLKSYLGFAIKSGNIIYGIESIKKYKHKISLVIVCNSITENGLKQINKVCNNKFIRLMQLTDIKLDDLLNTHNCKIVGLLDDNMANAIINTK